jgi:hypothetical protein
VRRLQETADNASGLKDCQRRERLLLAQLPDRVELRRCPLQAALYIIREIRRKNIMCRDDRVEMSGEYIGIDVEHGASHAG